MTSKLKCPFCQTELIGNSQASYCNQCAIYGYNEIWQALTQAKQDLEIARKALEEIDTSRCIPQQTLISLGKFSKTTRFNAGNIICVATPDYIHNILEQIGHKEI